MRLPTLSKFVLVASATYVSAQRKGLNDLAVQAKKSFFGTATDYPSTGTSNDKPYTDILSNKNEFGLLTPTYSMKMDHTQPARGQFDFSEADDLIKKAHADGQSVRCHTLLWYQAIPDWLKNLNPDKPTLTQILQNHITTVVSYFGSNCTSWDVVNEVFDDTAQHELRTGNIWMDVLGPDFITIAFDAARKAAPKDVKLYFSEYGTERPGPKLENTVRVVQDLVGKQLIDGVGIQGHFEATTMPSFSEIVDSIKRFTNMGLEVAFTEVDVRISAPADDAKLAQQKDAYQDIVQACVQVPQCKGIVLWDFVDGRNWVRTDNPKNSWPGTTSAAVWAYRGAVGSSEIYEKPAYQGCVTGLLNNSSPPSVISSPPSGNGTSPNQTPPSESSPSAGTPYGQPPSYETSTTSSTSTISSPQYTAPPVNYSGQNY